MPKKQGKIESDQTILAGLKKEMAKPRMVKSARKAEVNQGAARVARGKRGKSKL